MLFNLWSAHNSPQGAPAYLYILPVMNVLPWVAAVRWLRRVRDAARGGVLDAAGAARCYEIIQDLLLTTYSALVVIETTLGLARNFRMTWF